MSRLNDPIELVDTPSRDAQPSRANHEDVDTHNQHADLAPVDGGKAAWRLLLSAFMFEALLWGFPLSFGVFQDYYSRLPEFRDDRYISVVGTTASGISYLGAPLVAPIIRRWSRYRMHMILVGWPLCIGGLIAGSFANTLSTLILTQGVMYGMGFLTFYYPILSMVDEFWIRRRGMAYGLLCSASGVSGTIMPLVLQELLKKLGYKMTLRIMAVVLVVLTGPLIPFLKGRIGQQHTVGLKTDWSFLRLPRFWIYSFSNILMGLGYFFPSLYLPSYASAIGLSVTKGALLLVLMSISQVGGQFTFGYLSDKKLSLNTLIMTSSCVTATAIFSIWYLARSSAPLFAFALLYGFFGAAYTAMWARIVTSISDQPAASQSMFGLFNFGKGIGNIITGPIGAALLKSMENVAGQGRGMYKGIVVFSGLCWVLSAGSLCMVYCQPLVQKARSVFARDE